MVVLALKKAKKDQGETQTPNCDYFWGQAHHSTELAGCIVTGSPALIMVYI